MSVICHDSGMPFKAPAVFQLELEERIELWESELQWVQYNLDAARNFAEQIRTSKNNLVSSQ